MRRAEFLTVCRSKGKGALTAMAVGMVISGLFAFGLPSSERFAYFILHGAITGLTIYLSISLLEILFRPRQTWGHVVLFAAGGVIGWFFGMAIAFRNPATLLDRRWLGFMVLTITVVIAVGLLLRALEALHERIREQEWAQKELAIAREIQERLLPPPELEGHGYALSARNLPAQIVAGDFYDFVRLDDGSVAIVVADVAGKGMGASLIMASVKAVLPFIASQSVSAAMAQLNEKLFAELNRREFVAMAYARFFPETGRLDLANAGFPDPYVVRGASVEPLVARGNRLPLGMRAGIGYETATVTLNRGDRVVFVSDGIPEAQTKSGDSIGYDRLLEVVKTIRGDTASQWADSFLDRIRSEVAPTLTDDWTVVVLEHR
ncbi:MAG TPA: SpoIIE family protein phosphatase [Thermoanaerobaculia bacterium]|nr:SpoIIE family protein phosphatase [Thermoanaerobaculia bacterium]